MQDRLGDRTRIQHILKSCSLISKFTSGADFTIFLKDEMMFSACVRHLEIIGEAANKLSDDLRNANSNLNWSGIIGMRNILIHKYFGVDEKVIWDIIQMDLPKFESKIKEILADLK